MKKNHNNLNNNLQGVTIFNSNNKCTNAFDLITSIGCLRAAYADLKSKPGMMVKGTDKITLDGINEKWFEKTSEALRKEQYEFKPVRRVYIPKANGKKRPLGIGSPRDRIIQQAMKIVMESVLEPHFLENSHGFRPNRGCHTALKTIREWKGVAWFIEGDIKAFFDNIDHKILESYIEEHFKDARLIHLYWKLVKAGYVEWDTRKFIPSEVGVPQGGIISPLLSNLVLHQLDIFIEKKIKLLEEANKGEVPYIDSPKYHNLEVKIYRLNKKIQKLGNSEDKQKLKRLIDERRKMKSTIPNPKFTARIKYVRYADDWLIGVWGEKSFAEKLKMEIKEYLETLKLQLSEEKTLITNARTERAKFLGTYIKKVWVKGTLLTKNPKARLRKRAPGGNLWMTAPILDISKKLEKEGFIWIDKNNIYKAKAIQKFITMPLWDLVIRYKTIYTGYIQYYSFADNIYLFNKIYWILMGSLKMTIRRKYKLSWETVNKRWGRNISINKRVGRIDKTQRFEFNKLERKPMNFKVSIEKWNDPLNAKIWNNSTISCIGEQCVNCGTSKNIEMHHLKHIKTFNTKLNTFDKMLAKINRKQVPLCKECHVRVHKGEHQGFSLRHLNTKRRQAEI